MDPWWYLNHNHHGISTCYFKFMSSWPQSQLITIAYTVAISTMVANGLGQPQSRLVSEDIEDFQRVGTPPWNGAQHDIYRLDQAGYASQLLYVPALCLAKLSILIYLRALSPDTPFAILNRILEVFIVIWGISTEFALAFQCRLPNPWTVISGRCFNMVLQYLHILTRLKLTHSRSHSGIQPEA